MTADKERALSGGTQMLCTIGGTHIAENGRTILMPNDLAARVWAGDDRYMDRQEWEEYDARIFRVPPPDKIILNTNRNMDKPIRLFSDSEQAQNTIDYWDPMRLSGMFSDDAESKDVLETLDDLRDRLR